LDVFIDESGDMGFSPKATSYFIAAYVVVPNPILVRTELSKLLKKLHKSRLYSGDELKFSKSSRKTRLKVLEKMIRYDWSGGLIVIEKSKTKNDLRSKPNILYNYLIVHNVIKDTMIDLKSSEDLCLHIDRSLSRSNREAFDEYARNKADWVWNVELARSPRLRDNQIRLVHDDSRDDCCIQLADFVSGSAFQFYEKGDNEYYSLIREKIARFHKW